MAYSDLTREIDQGPEGPHIGAFFDLDRTLVAGFSVFAFFSDALFRGRIGPSGLALTSLAGLRFQLGQLGFSGLLTEAAALLRGENESALVEIGERLFEERIAGDIYPEARAIVAAHRRKGHTLAIVSSATRYQVEPLARELGIPHALCTHLEVADGRFTGGIVRPTCYGDGKLLAARELAMREDVALEDSWFYTDSHEDLPLLEGVGRPRPTNPNRTLAAIAATRGWPQRTFHTRGLPSATDVLRTSLAIGALVPSMLLGLPAAALEGRWRPFVNIAASTWGEVGTALAGIGLRVHGEQHLWSHRPAVFMFNHQSAVEVLLLCKMLHRDFVGISKQEVKKNPIFGPAFTLVGTVFIDRSNSKRAIDALRPAIQALREGLSIAIAPEGTRSSTGRLGKFKKGAFHIAMAGKVPIVPIVFMNSLDALPKHAVVARPATVDVVVHPPIDTSTWTVHDIEEQVAKVERLYQETLDTWSS
ncbi:MAG TPA: HAD-IB family hydrolase [Candidatus Binatia bacterium]|nr:HAD-IB family hydrolase [Candidatus Binatia bacterium]